MMIFPFVWLIPGHDDNAPHPAHAGGCYVRTRSGKLQGTGEDTGALGEMSSVPPVSVKTKKVSVDGLL